MPDRNDTVVYFECDPLDAQAAALRQKDNRFTQLPRDEPWLWREARWLDPPNDGICLDDVGVNRLDPPWCVRER